MQEVFMLSKKWAGKNKFELKHIFKYHTRTNFPQFNKCYMQMYSHKLTPTLQHIYIYIE